MFRNEHPLCTLRHVFVGTYSYFIPPFSSEECPESVPPFHCSKGLFVEGSVDPPLEGVAITVTLSNGQQIDVRTDRSGYYAAEPLPKAVTHTVVCANYMSSVL